jgi:hypothetical protein
VDIPPGGRGIDQKDLRLRKKGSQRRKVEIRVIAVMVSRLGRCLVRGNLDDIADWFFESCRAGFLTDTLIIPVWDE